MFSGIDQDSAKNMAEKLIYYDVAYFFKYGDVFVYETKNKELKELNR